MFVLRYPGSLCLFERQGRAERVCISTDVHIQYVFYTPFTRGLMRAFAIDAFGLGLIISIATIFFGVASQTAMLADCCVVTVSA